MSLAPNTIYDAQYTDLKITEWGVIANYERHTSDRLSLMPLHIWIIQPFPLPRPILHTSSCLTKLYSDQNLISSLYTYREEVCWFTNVSISCTLFFRHAFHNEWMNWSSSVASFSEDTGLEFDGPCYSNLSIYR